MSRCFPFPPPGYEKKIRTEEADSLIKERHKEKKHKKDKKDKERKEGKEKKDKETSKDKHKERKEKKEKRKDRKEKDKDRDREKSRTSEDKKSAGVLPNNGNGESKFVQDLARRIRDEEEATESQSQIEEKRINTHRNSAMEKRPESAVRQVSSCMDQKGAEVMVKPVEKKDPAKKQELQEKNHHRRESVTKSDKPLDKSEPKNITDRHNIEKKEEKTEVVKKTVEEKPKFIEGGPRLKEREHNSVDARNFGVQDLPRAGVKSLTSEGILGKRKDLETNGVLYENGSRPNKIQRPSASPISSVENGRKLGASQTHPKPVSELQGTVCNLEVKEHKSNGFIYPQEPKSHTPVSSVKVKENGETVAKKRPHSDLKYLDQILNVPKREELHEVDDDQEEWLFGHPGGKLLKKQRADSATSLVETQQIWNQAIRIESADIVALPYVVPF